MLPRSKKRPIKSNGSHTDRYALMIVNITDSAQRSLDNYIRKQEIRIPESDKTSANFTFAVQPRNESGQGRFNLVRERTTLQQQQQRAGTGGVPAAVTTLESLGQIRDRLVVRAKDDIFERTRKKILVAEEIRQKTRTKLLENEFKNTKLTGRQLIASGNCSATAAAAAAAAVATTTTKPSMMATSRKATMMAMTAAVTAAAAAEKPRIVKRPVPPPQQQQQPQQQPQQLLTATDPAEKKLCVRRKKTFLRDIKRVPLKERLIHLLALRTATKLEIVSRVRDVEGIAGKLPASITTILNEIAYFKNNKYELKRHMWNEVRDNWPHYSESERQLLERRKPNNLTPLESDESLRKSSDSKLTNETIATNKTIATTLTQSSGYESMQSLVAVATKRAEPLQQQPQPKQSVVPPKPLTSCTDLNMPSLDCLGTAPVATVPVRIPDPRRCTVESAAAAAAALKSRKRPFPSDSTSDFGPKRRKLAAAIHDLPLPEFAKSLNTTRTRNECLPNEKPPMTTVIATQPPPPSSSSTKAVKTDPVSLPVAIKQSPIDYDDTQLSESERKLIELRNQMSDPEQFMNSNDVCLLIKKTICEFPLKFQVPKLVSPGHGIDSIVVAAAVPTDVAAITNNDSCGGRKRISFDAYRKRFMNSNENNVVDDDYNVDEYDQNDAAAAATAEATATIRTDDDDKSEDRNSSMMAFPIYEPDYLTEFGPIQSPCQFKQYLNEFHHFHPFYEQLRIVVNCAATTFREFDLLRYKIEKITDNIERHDQFLKFAHDVSQLRNLYRLCGYNEIRGLYNYIDGKLMHIRTCLIDYYAAKVPTTDRSH